MVIQGNDRGDETMMQAALYQTTLGIRETLALQNPPAFRRITEEEESKGYRHPTVYLDPAATFQTLEGIGGAMTEAACWTLSQMPGPMRSEVLRSYFAPPGGCGYDVIRFPMNSCDFSIEHYSCCDTEGDFELKTFRMERERKWMIPMVKEALSLHPGLKVLLSPWSPPAWMKSNGEMDHGGKLRKECLESWANYYCRYIEALGAEGIPVWGLTVNNEPNASQPWDSLILSANEERDFIRDHLGPALARNGYASVKVLIWDHNRDYLYNRASVIYRDPEASKYVWGAAFHWYGDNCYENVDLTHDAFPDKNLFFTEGCNGGNNHYDLEWSADEPDPNGIFLHRGIWEAGERYARNMIQDFNHHTSGWLDWNMVLDEKGGPRHLPGGCGAPYLYNVQTGVLEQTTSFPYLAHFFHFLRAGAVRIAAAPSKNALECTAFRNPDGKIVLMVMNRTGKALSFDCVCGDQAARATIPPRSIQTWQIVSCD